MQTDYNSNYLRGITLFSKLGIGNIKNIVHWVTFGIAIILNIVLLVVPDSFQDNAAFRISIILNFFVTFIFSWLLTEKSIEKSYEEKIKTSAIRSYRQIKTIGDNIKYFIGLVDRKLKSVDRFNSREEYYSVLELRNLLYIILLQVNNSKNDWGDDIKDMRKIKKLEAIDQELINLRINNFEDPDFESRLKELIEEKQIIAEEINDEMSVSFENQSIEYYSFDPTTGNKIYSMSIGSHADPSYIYFIRLVCSEFYKIDNLENDLKSIIAPIGYEVKSVFIYKDNSYGVVIECSGDLRQNKEYVRDSILQSNLNILEVNIQNFFPSTQSI